MNPASVPCLEVVCKKHEALGLELGWGQVPVDSSGSRNSIRVIIKAGREAGRESSELVHGLAAEGTAYPAGALTYEQMDGVNI